VVAERRRLHGGGELRRQMTTAQKLSACARGISPTNGNVSSLRGLRRRNQKGRRTLSSVEVIVNNAASPAERHYEEDERLGLGRGTPRTIWAVATICARRPGMACWRAVSAASSISARINGQAGQYGQVNYAAAKSGITALPRRLGPGRAPPRAHRQRHRAWLSTPTWWRRCRPKSGQIGRAFGGAVGSCVGNQRAGGSVPVADEGGFYYPDLTMSINGASICMRDLTSSPWPGLTRPSRATK